MLKGKSQKKIRKREEKKTGKLGKCNDCTYYRHTTRGWEVAMLKEKSEKRRKKQENWESAGPSAKKNM